MCKKITISTGYIYPKKQKMAVLSECNYKNLARILIDTVGGDEFFNGTVIFEGEGICLNFKATLLVYRDKTGNDAGGVSPISDIKPVWYECEIIENGRVISNEFSWHEFKKFLPGDPGCN